MATLLLLGYGTNRASHMETLRALAGAAGRAQEDEPASGRSKLS